jgi:hypothetical protein
MRRRVSVEIDGTVAVVRGWLAHKLAVEAGLRPTFSGVCGGWMFDTKRLPDLVAHLERRRIAFDVQEPEAEHPDVSRADDLVVDDTEIPLFELDGGR